MSPSACAHEEPHGRAARFPSRSGGGTLRARGLVPLAKRGEPKGGGDSRLQHAPACDECTLVGANGGSPYDQKFSVAKGLRWFEFSNSRVKFEDVVEVWVRVGFLGGGVAQSLAWLRIFRQAGVVGSVAGVGAVRAGWGGARRWRVGRRGAAARRVCGARGLAAPRRTD
jgi:hypothetical protein